jgi:hypothetical protein
MHGIIRLTVTVAGEAKGGHEAMAGRLQETGARDRHCHPCLVLRTFLGALLGIIMAGRTYVSKLTVQNAAKRSISFATTTAVRGLIV